MKLYNHVNGIILFVVLFLIWAYLLGQSCPCTTESRCVRHEFYGVQFNHFVLYVLIGMAFPSYFYTFQIIGVLWEIAEYILDKNPQWVVKYIGGCLKYPPPHHKEEDNKVWDYTVYRGIEKPLNVVDQVFQIKNSTIHGWHGSPAELIPNVLGFGVGYMLNKKIIKELF